MEASKDIQMMGALLHSFPFSGYTGDIKDAMQKAIDAMAIVEHLGLWDEIKNVPLLLCGECKHFCNAGDYDLCCAISERRLCYANTEACEKGERNGKKNDAAENC